MIKKAVTTLLLTATTFNRVVVFDNVVEYEENNKVKTTEYTDIYRTEKQTSYGKLLTWQMVNVQKSENIPMQGYTTYIVRTDLLYRIDNVNTLPIEIERRFTLTNTSYATNGNQFNVFITQATENGITYCDLENKINLTPDQLIENKTAIIFNLNNLASNTTTTYSKPLYYLQQTVNGQATYGSNLDKTSNTPTAERVMYIYGQISAVLVFNNNQQTDINRQKYTRFRNINSISTATIENEDVEVIDLPGLLFSILTMPFSFISVAFNLTIFPGTPYQLNISNLIMTIIASLLLIFIIRKFLK